MDSNARPLLLDAPRVRRVWGGDRFHDAGGPIGEVWLVHEGNVIRQGPGSGSTLAAATESMGKALLGRRVIDRGERTFPLLIKLIDAAEWLSIQVHPDDEQAVKFEGPGHRGKTEAWYVLDAEPGAEIIAGIKPGFTPARFDQAIGNETILDMVQRFPLQAGDAVLLPAGAVHALGPGLLIYEIQQSSDSTYRLYDWDRQRVDGRSLHPEQSLMSARPSLQIDPVHVHDPAPGSLALVAVSDFFQLMIGRTDGERIVLKTGGEAFHVITVIEGAALVSGSGWSQELKLHDTAIIPASVYTYGIDSDGVARFLLAIPG